jgi:hypothetical protein
LHFDVKTFIIGGMNVAVNIRMPVEMKRALDTIAQNEFRSLNSLILQFLNDHLKSKDIDWRKEDQKKIKR